MVRKVVCLAISLCLAFAAVCGAEEKKEEWVDKAFDFKTIRTVAVQLEVAAGLTIGEIERKKLDELVETRILKADNQRLRLISAAQLEESVGKIIGADMGLLKIEDKDKYAAAMREYTPKLVDAILTVTVRALSTEQIFVPDRIYTYTTYETQNVYVTRYDPYRGNYTDVQTVKIPVQHTGVIPAHYENLGHAGAEFALALSGDGKKVWLLVDMRDGNGKPPLEMTERIFKRSMDRLRNATKSR